jgi:peptidoglycan hydrolase-like protein with peptidoglycan-binding domain
MPAEADMTDANRREVQEALRRLGYYRGPMDGIIGRRTRAAIHRFQQDIGAEPTGSLTADQATWLVSTR